MTPIHLSGDIHFRLRFNTKHGDTNLYWRVFIDDQEYLVAGITCLVPTHSDAAFDKEANEMKYNMAGVCREFIVDEQGTAVFR